MEEKFVVYRGTRMIEGWPERIREAQTITTIWVDGVEHTRIRYGEETNGWTAENPCHDCRVIKGEFHVPSCDVEQCPRCGEQLIGCDCEVSEGPDTAD